MKEVVAITIALLLGALLYTNYQSNDKYYDAVAPSRGEMNLLERSALVLEREIDIEQRKEESVLKRFESGEMTLAEYEDYLDRRSKREQKEIEDAFSSMGSMYDPDKGMFSGAFKMAQKPAFKQREQIKKLDAELKTIVSEMSRDDPSVTKAKLSIIKWVPTGDAKIDDEMDKHYQGQVETLLKQM